MSHHTGAPNTPAGPRTLRNGASSRRRVARGLGAFAFAAVVAVSGAKAADWKPTSDVEFVIPYGLGGGADLLARVIIKIMTEEKMVPVNVTAVNKPGGGASVGVAWSVFHTYIWPDRPTRPDAWGPSSAS